MSLLIRRELTDRARDFNVIVDDVSITDLTFGKDYTAAVEAKQVRWAALSSPGPTGLDTLLDRKTRRGWNDIASSYVL